MFSVPKYVEEFQRICWKMIINVSAAPAERRVKFPNMNALKGRKSSKKRFAKQMRNAKSNFRIQSRCQPI